LIKPVESRDFAERTAQVANTRHTIDIFDLCKFHSLAARQKRLRLGRVPRDNFLLGDHLARKFVCALDLHHLFLVLAMTRIVFRFWGALVWRVRIDDTVGFVWRRFMLVLDLGCLQAQLTLGSIHLRPQGIDIHRRAVDSSQGFPLLLLLSIPIVRIQNQSLEPQVIE
jgi:hypothetical protein